MVGISSFFFLSFFHWLVLSFLCFDGGHPVAKLKARRPFSFELLMKQTALERLPQSKRPRSSSPISFSFSFSLSLLHFLLSFCLSLPPPLLPIMKRKKNKRNDGNSEASAEESDAIGIESKREREMERTKHLMTAYKNAHEPAA